MPQDRLYVTYFGGDKAKGLEPDNEAKEYWLKLGYGNITSSLLQSFRYVGTYKTFAFCCTLN